MITEGDTNWDLLTKQQQSQHPVLILYPLPLLPAAEDILISANGR